MTENSAGTLQVQTSTIPITELRPQLHTSRNHKGGILIDVKEPLRSKHNSNNQLEIAMQTED